MSLTGSESAATTNPETNPGPYNNNLQIANALSKFILSGQLIIEGPADDRTDSVLDEITHKANICGLKIVAINARQPEVFDNGSDYMKAMTESIDDSTLLIVDHVNALTETSGNSKRQIGAKRTLLQALGSTSFIGITDYAKTEKVVPEYFDEEFVYSLNSDQLDARQTIDGDDQRVYSLEDFWRR